MPSEYGRIPFPQTGKGQNNMSNRAKAKPNISEFSEKEVLPMWTPNQIIRHRTNGRVLLVLHVYNNCTLVVDMNCQEELVEPKALLQREYHYYARDTDMKNEDELEYTKDWRYKPTFME
jgi:hypothetical protein